MADDDVVVEEESVEAKAKRAAKGKQAAGEISDDVKGSEEDITSCKGLKLKKMRMKI